MRRSNACKPISRRYFAHTLDPRSHTPACRRPGATPTGTRPAKPYAMLAQETPTSYCSQRSPTASSGALCPTESEQCGQYGGHAGPGHHHEAEVGALCFDPCRRSGSRQRWLAPRRLSTIRSVRTCRRLRAIEVGFREVAGGSIRGAASGVTVYRSWLHQRANRYRYLAARERSSACA